MAKIRILTEADIRKFVALDLEAVACIENAFDALATQPVVMPPILRLDIHEFNGEVDVKTAYVPGLDSFAIKVSPGFFDNPKLGLPSVNGMMMALSAKTGLLEALLLDNGYLTDVRTAAAGAVAARHLARADASCAAIIGAGMQAALQLEALTLVRPITKAIIWGRDPAKGKILAENLGQRLKIDVSFAQDPRTAIKGADIIVTTTPATEPLLEASWIEAGQHLTAMGSDAEHKNEIDPKMVARADLYVADSLSQTRRLGELHHAIAKNFIKPDTLFAELGDIISTQRVGRTNDNQITYCDLTGTGVQDTAIATHALLRATSENAGLSLEN